MKYLELIFPGVEIQEGVWDTILTKLKDVEGPIGRFFTPVDVVFLLKGNKLHFFLGVPEDKAIVFMQEGNTGNIRLRQNEEENLPPAFSNRTHHFFLRKNLVELIENKLERKGQLFVAGRLTRKFRAYILKLMFQHIQTNRLETYQYIFFKFPYSFLTFKIGASSPYKLYNKQEELDLSQVVLQFAGNYPLGAIDSFSLPSQPKFYLESFEFFRHTAIVGQTGVGKSKFIELFLQKFLASPLKEDTSVVLIDPHDAIASNLQDKVPFKKIDFQQNSVNLFFNRADPTLSSELTLLLFETLLSERWNDRLKRLLRYTLFLLFSIQKLEIPFLRTFLTDILTRKEVLKQFSGADNIRAFFDTEFIEFQTKFYDTTFIPILNLIEELNFIPAILQPANAQMFSIEQLMQENKLIIFSLNRMKLGSAATRMIVGMIIQYIFMLAQTRAIDKKIILGIDEVPIVENKALPQILSEARKFDLGIWLAMQYLGQLSGEILDSVLANIYNWFAFKVSSDDAKILADNIEIQFTTEFAKRAKDLGFSTKDIKEKLLTSLNPRECITRIYTNGRFTQAFKMKVEKME